MHLLIDGYAGDTQRMWDRDFVHKFLEDFPVTLGMNKIYGPVVLQYDAPKPEDSGVSGFVVIAESHISVHTFPERSYVNIDIFSCKAFDSQKALDRVKEQFRLQNMKTWQVDRGLEHYDPSLARPRQARDQVAGPADD